MKKLTIIIIILLLANAAEAQERDRLSELDVVCRNEFVTYTSVAPDGSLWMATHCGEIYRADNIHSPWHILKEGELGGNRDETFENIVAFDHDTAVIVGNMWGNYFKRTTSGGKTWDKVNYSNKRGFPEWFHPVWRGQNGNMWTGSQDGYLAFSSDGGRTFKVLRDTAFDHKADIRDIYMLSSDSGWIAVRNNGLYSTSDNWHTYNRLSTPNQKGVSRVRPWKNHLIVTQGRKSYYTPVDGDGRWQRTPLTLLDFEVDTSTGLMWAIDENNQVILMEEIDKWQTMEVSALFIIGVHDGRLYCRINGGVMRVGRDGVVDNCPFLTAKQSIKNPAKTFIHGDISWGYDEKSVYLHDNKSWYRVARPLNIASALPDPNRKDRIIIMTYSGENFSIDTAGKIESYIAQQPLASFVKPGLQSLSITTYTTLGHGVCKEYICFQRIGDIMVEKSRTESRKKIQESYDPHLSNGPVRMTSTFATEDDSDIRQLPVASIEKALITLGERYAVFPSPLDFGLNDTMLDIHKVYAERSSYSTNKFGYNITLVNQAGDSLTAFGQTSAYLDLGGSTHYPWLLPMVVKWREAEFQTYQPILWQVLREAMPDNMQLRGYLDNSTLHPRYTLQTGDLLFLNTNKSDMEQSITASTGEYTHVALVERDSADDVWIIEALPKKGVRRISFSQYEREYSIRFFMGSFDTYRLTVPFNTAAVIARAKSLIGKPYDNAFLPDNDAYYCSELIEVAFDGLFPSKPMNWRDSDGNLPEYWKKHFKKLGIPVPEGVPGTNPTDLSKSPLLKKL